MPSYTAVCSSSILRKRAASCVSVRSSSSSRSWRRTRSSSALACSSSLSACCCSSAAPFALGFFQLLAGFFHLLLRFAQPLGRRDRPGLAAGGCCCVAVFVAWRRRAGLAWRSAAIAMAANCSACDGLAIGGLTFARFAWIAGSLSDGLPDRMVCRICESPGFCLSPGFDDFVARRVSCRRLVARLRRLAFRSLLTWLVFVVAFGFLSPSDFLVAFGLGDVAAEFAGVGGDALLIVAERFSSSPPSVRARTPFCMRISRPTSFKYFADAVALRRQLLVAIGLEQQREQAVELLLQLGLIRGRGGEPLVFQQLDDRFEPHIDVLLAALGDRLAQQLGPARVGRRRELGQPADDFFQPLEPIGQAGLLDGKLIVGRQRACLAWLSGVSATPLVVEAGVGGSPAPRQVFQQAWALERTAHSITVSRFADARRYHAKTQRRKG